MSRMRDIIICLSMIVLLASCGRSSAPIIMDTGIGSECSEAVGLALLNNDAGGNVLAMVTSSRSDLAVPVVEAVNAYYGNGGVPVGESKRSAPEPELWHSDTKWTEYIAETYPHIHQRSSEAPDAVAVYRGVLEHQRRGSVTIVSTGFFTNLRDLLISQPDDYSPRTGLELVSEKVKVLYVVAGMAEGDREFNIEMDPVAAKYVMENWPGEIYVIGRGAGVRLFTEIMPDTTITGNPLADIYRLSMRNGDASVHCPFAAMAVIAAIEGHDKNYKTERGILRIDETGRDTWEADKDGSHFRLEPRGRDDRITAVIEKKIRDAMKR